MAAALTARRTASPLFHIVNAFDGCFVARTPGGGWSGRDLAVIAIWGVAGLAVAARRLGTEPVSGERRLRHRLPSEGAAT